MTETAAGQVFAAWLEAYNSADAATMDAFDAKYVPVGPKLKFLMSNRTESGVLALKRVQSSKPTSVVVLLRGQDSGANLRFELHVSEGASPVVTDLRLETATQ